MRTKTRQEQYTGVCPSCGERVPGRNVYQPVEGCIIIIDGVETVLNKGHFFREGHPLVEAHPEMFQPVRVQYDVEQATDAPGELRDR